MRTANSYRSDSGSLYGREISISYLEHGVDAAEDRMLLHLWEPNTDRPEHAFGVYRDGPGWGTLWAGLTGGPEQMAKAADWWAAQHTTAAYAGYRILAAIDGHGQISLAQLAQELDLSAGELTGEGRYARTLAALIQQQYVAADASSVRVTPDADPVLRPEDPQAVGQFAQALASVDTEDAVTRPAAGTVVDRPATYAHWAVFDNPDSAAGCAQELNAQAVWTADHQPTRVSGEWLVLATCETTRGAFATHEQQAHLVAEQYGALVDGPDRVHHAGTAAGHPSAAAYPATPRPGTATATETAAATDTPAVHAAADRRHTR